MNKGDVYVTPLGQHRVVLGKTLSGEVAFATKGENVIPDYNHCEIRPVEKFMSKATYNRTVAADEILRIEQKFANYILANSIT